MLAELSDIQETFRSLFRDLYKEVEGDSDLHAREDAIVAIAIAHLEMTNSHGDEPYLTEPNENYIMAAIEFLDNLDTMNMTVTCK